MIINRFAEILRQRGKTVREVSQETGCSYNTILSLSRGQSSRIDLTTIDAVCRELQCQPGEIFQWQPDPHPIQKTN